MRKLITILLILFSFAASSQVIRANRYYVPVASCNYFGSDSIPAALYSFRNVNPCRYSGNCVKIRRASDNTTSDFGFVSNYVDTAAIKNTQRVSKTADSGVVMFTGLLLGFRQAIKPKN